MTYSHQPVLTAEIIHYLKPKPGQIFIDGTLGGGGHTLAIMEKILPGGKILGIDLDPKALEAAEARIDNKKNSVLARGNFNDLKKIADVHKFDKVDGILLDLGLSSGQLQDQARGFSFLADGRLDMRFGPEIDLTAAQILNSWSQEDLCEIFKNYGEEKLAKPISKRIAEFRKEQPLSSPSQLVEIATEIYKKYYRGRSKINPATKIFQAIRIAVNRELENLENVLPQAIDLLAGGGRLAVISYHSLEDRIVKHFFQRESRDCICPPELPQCQCNHKKTLKIITRKPIIPTEEEVMNNPRSRSAKLRIAEKL